MAKGRFGGRGPYIYMIHNFLQIVHPCRPIDACLAIESEALSKAGLQRRKASSRLAVVTLAKVEAESQVEAQQKECLGRWWA